MNFFDIIVIVILGYCLVRGVFRGLIKELSSIIGVLGGFYAAFTYYPLVAKPLSKWITNIGHLNILSFLIIFCGVFIIISILGVIINYLLKIAFLSWLDRILGSVFGAMKGMLIVSVLFIALTAFLPKGTPVIKDSLLSPYVTLVSEKIAKVVSKDMKFAFSSKIATIKKAWEKNK